MNLSNVKSINAGRTSKLQYVDCAVCRFIINASQSKFLRRNPGNS